MTKKQKELRRKGKNIQNVLAGLMLVLIACLICTSQLVKEKKIVHLPGQEINYPNEIDSNNVKLPDYTIVRQEVYEEFPNVIKEIRIHYGEIKVYLVNDFDEDYSYQDNYKEQQLKNAMTFFRIIRFVFTGVAK